MAQMERIPPHNDEAEKSVLGAILQDKEVFFQVSEIVKADDFYSSSHREIFNSMTDLYQRSEPIDLITVCDCLKRRNSLEAVGGRTYIALLSTMVPTTANASQYARIISQKAVLRKLITASSEINEMSFSEKLDPQTVLDRAEASIFEIAKTRQRNEYETIKQVVGRNLEQIEEAQKNGGQIPGLATGYKILDSMTTGLQPSDLIIIAARPSMGKTAFALNIAQYAGIRKGERVVIFSLEMSKEQLGIRFLSQEARINSKDLRTGNLTEENWADLNEAVGRISGADIIID
ncbi:MAG: replicative DNA helicase, partial [Firmicutes bacterium]|nr:replicative DNA helicase [Bacillota bacterium]